MLIAIVSGPEDGRVSELTDEDGQIVLGRQGTLQLADRKVSKRHAQLRKDGGAWYVEDMGSTNGTYVNGQRVDRPRRVTEGDRLALGSTVMVIKKLSPPAPPPVREPEVDSEPQPHAQAQQQEQDSAPPIDDPLWQDWPTQEGPHQDLLEPPQPEPIEQLQPGEPPQAQPEPMTIARGADSTTPITQDEAQAAELPPVEPPAEAPAEASAEPAPPAKAEANQQEQRALTRAQADDESLAAWTITLPRGAEFGLGAPALLDESVLSLRPLARHEPPPPVPAWRRTLPYAILALVLVAVIANIVLIVLFRRDARRDVQDLRAALEQRDQASAELIVQEVREELRTPSPQQMKAWEELTQALSAKQEIFNERLREDLTAREKEREAAAKERGDGGRESTADAQAAVARELAEMRKAIAGLQRPAQEAGAPAAAVAQQQAQPAAATVAGGNAKGAAATPAVGASKAVDQAFLIDASGALERAIPAAAAEIRRALRENPPRVRVRVLLLYQGRLMELEAAALASPEGADAIDHGDADLPKALRNVLADRPRALYLLSDTLGDLATTRGVIRAADTAGTSINVTQFFSRNNREELKSLAREYHGTYTYVSPSR